MDLNVLDAVRELIRKGDVEQAIQRAKDFLRSSATKHDEAYYLIGNAYRKQGNWQQALNNYRYAAEINPQSPARQARQMVMDILNFYNKDMYNQ